MTMAPPGSAAWPAAMIVWGPGFRSTAHAHHCVQLLLTMRGTVRARGGPGRHWITGGALLVRPDAVHQAEAPGDAVLIGFIDAESELGRAMAERIPGEIAAVPFREVSRWRAALGPSLTKARVDRWLRTHLLPHPHPVALHPGVQRVLAHLRARLDVAREDSLPALAGIAGLSHSRFMHVFTESVGVPLRPYVRWLRLQQAACELMDGATVSQAAHRAGFADAAHLTRTFRRMLGTTPSDLALRRRMAAGTA